MIAQNANAAGIQSREIHVVYDPASGQIVHIHRTTTWEGAKPRATGENAARARALAERVGHRVEGLKVVRVEEKEIHLRRQQWIDPRTERILLHPPGGPAARSSDERR